MGFRLMKRKNKLHGMIIKIINMNKSTKLRTNAFIHAYLLVCYLSQSSSVRHGFPFDVQSLTKNRTRVHCFCIKRIFLIWLACSISENSNRRGMLLISVFRMFHRVEYIPFSQ